jgi:uncharacterized protein YjcR
MPRLTSTPRPRTIAFKAELQDFCAAELGRCKELANYLGIKPNAVSNWWRPDRWPSTEQMLGAMEWMRAREAGKHE